MALVERCSRCCKILSKWNYCTYEEKAYCYSCRAETLIEKYRDKQGEMPDAGKMIPPASSGNRGRSITKLRPFDYDALNTSLEHKICHVRVTDDNAPYGEFIYADLNVTCDGEHITWYYFYSDTDYPGDRPPMLSGQAQESHDLDDFVSKNGMIQEMVRFVQSCNRSEGRASMVMLPDSEVERRISQALRSFASDRW